MAASPGRDAEAALQAAAEEEAAAAAEAVAFRAKRAARRRAELVAEGEEIGEELKASGLVTAWSEARPGEPGYADEDGVPVYREPGPQRHTYVVLELRPQRSSRARRNAQQKSGRARADSRAAGRALLLSCCRRTLTSRVACLTVTVRFRGPGLCVYVKSWGAPPKNLGVRIRKGATRRLTIYAFDASVSQHV